MRMMKVLIALMFLGHGAAFGAGNDNDAKNILLSELPTLASVQKAFPNGDKIQDRARFGAACAVLISVVDVVSFIPGNLQAADVLRHRGVYIDAVSRLNHGLSTEDQRKLFRMTSKVKHSSRFQRDVHDAFFSDSWMATFEQTRGQQQARVEAMNRPASSREPTATRTERVTLVGILLILAVAAYLSAKSSSPGTAPDPKESSDGRVRPTYGFSTSERQPGQFEISFQRVRMGLSERMYWFFSVGILSGMLFIGLGTLTGVFDMRDSYLPLIPIALTFWVPAFCINRLAAYRQRPGRILVTATQLTVEKNMRGDLAKFDRDHIRAIYIRHPAEGAVREMQSTTIVGGTGIVGGMYVASHLVGHSFMTVGEGMRQWGSAVSAKSGVSIRFDYADRRGIMVAGGFSPARADALFDEFERVLQRAR